MKKTLLLLFSWFGLFLPAASIAQTDSVGVPVIRFIGNFYGEGEAICYPNPSIIVSFPHSTESGVTYLVVIDSITVPDHVFLATTNDTLHVGDVLNITASSWQFSFIFSANGKIFGKCYAAGMPTTAGETYPCDTMSYMDLLVLCNDHINYGFPGNCTDTVMAVPNQVDRLSFQLYPNPSVGNFRLETFSDFRKGTMLLINDRGQEIYSQNLKPGENEIHTVGIPPGVYGCILLEDGKIAGSSRVVIGD